MLLSGFWSGPMRPELFSCSCTSCETQNTNFRYRAEAIAAWNRRAPDAIVPDPEDEGQRRAVRMAIMDYPIDENKPFSERVEMRDQQAAAILTALRDATRGAGR